MSDSNVRMYWIDDVKGKGVVAEKALGVGTMVVSAQIVEILDERTTLSVEVESGYHILLDEPAARINHSCEPNTVPIPNRFGAYDFVAIRDIQEAEEITFDYAATESEVVRAFPCTCDSVNCRGIVTGYMARGVLTNRPPLREGSYVGGLFSRHERFRSK